MLNDVCQPCVENCGTGNSSAIYECLACNEGMYMNGAQCSACPENCRTCESGTKCNTCKTGYVLRMDLCLLPCNEGCRTCDKNPEQCLTCFGGYELNS